VLGSASAVRDTRAYRPPLYLCFVPSLLVPASNGWQMEFRIAHSQMMPFRRGRAGQRERRKEKERTESTTPAVDHPHIVATSGSKYKKRKNLKKQKTKMQ